MATPQLDVTHRAPCVEQHRWRGEPQRPALYELWRPVEWRQPSNDHTPHTTMRPTSASRRRLPSRTLRTALSPDKSRVDSAANTEPMATPTGVAIVKPVLLLPSKTPRSPGRAARESRPRTGRRARRRAGVHPHGVQPPRRRPVRRRGGGNQYQPEVRRMVLPPDIEAGPLQQQNQT